VLKKASPKNVAARNAPDIPADDPKGTMERFNSGLRKVLSAPRERRTERIGPSRTRRK